MLRLFEIFNFCSKKNHEQKNKIVTFFNVLCINELKN